MKQKNSFPSLFALLILSLSVMTGLVVYYQKRLVPTSTRPDPIVTKPIDTSHGIGGVAELPADKPKLTPTLPPGQGATARTSNSGTLVPTDTSSAPGQAAVESAITVEHHYRALANPNDPYYTSTSYPAWALTSTGAPAAWDQSTGAPIVVAVIDTGFALQHEDLASQWYINPGESGMTTAGDKCWTGTPDNKVSNKCDDDSNNYVDDWRGWNFYGRYTPTANPCAPDGLGTFIANNNPQAGQSGDDILYQESKDCFGTDAGDPYVAISHGTSTAGLAGAATNNGKGIATYNWNIKVMPLQALGDDGSGWTSRIVAAIYYAVDNGAKIVSLSLGGDSPDTALKAAIDYAYAHGVVVVAAAGNCGTGTEYGCDPTKPGAMGYPALYNHVIAVGASDAMGKRADFSSYGPAVDVLAPGSGAIVSPLIDRGMTPNDQLTFNYSSAYSGSLYGTSFATPIVTSLASLILSERPTATPDDITALLDASATKVSAMNGSIYAPQYGHGVINADTATRITMALKSSSSTPRLAQTGDHRSEHSVSDTALMSSACNTAVTTYCTVRMHNITYGYDRYLPYTLAGSSGSIGWQWPGNVLVKGEWEVRAVQGSNQSGVYNLFFK